jgi:hypothetical protein
VTSINKQVESVQASDRVNRTNALGLMVYVIRPRSFKGMLNWSNDMH